LAITIYFLERDPALIERRLTVGPSAESEPTQQRIQVAASLFVVLMYIVAGLDWRFSWSPSISASSVLAADAAVALGFAGIFLAFRANSHAAGVIQVSTGQTVVSSGAYGVVRHPMYSGALILFLSTPVALASVWALLPAIGLAVTLIVRLLDEERFLGAHLAGYDAYQRRVRYRLMPGIW
jgi:protein-S-isoprenylcysteine O-methyltransferase Ste14